MSDIDIEVKGLIELQEKTEDMIAALHGAPILNAMRDSTLSVQRDAKINAPVDTGRLRASITPAIESMTDTITGIVGSNVEYAPYQEFGTYRKKKVNVAIMGGSFEMTGFTRGVKPKLYLTRAFETNQAKIIRRFENALEEIVNL